MKVLFDYQAFQIQNHGGVSRGFAEVISRLNSYGIDWEIAIKDSKNIYLRDLLPQILLSGKFETKLSFYKRYPFKGIGALYNLLKQFKLVRDSAGINKAVAISKIQEGQYDVFHATFFDCYFLEYIQLVKKEVPIVITIHDMIPELFPNTHNNKQAEAKKELADYASYIIVPSYNTKADVVKLLHVDEKKIQVIHWGADVLSESYLNGLKKLVPYQYILYVGARAGYKGFETFVHEFKKINSWHPEIKLICTGIPFTKMEQKLINRLELSEKVYQMFVNQQELHALYKYAKAFVYPSLYEGFGIPIYEAFSCCCPTFLNDTSCFREIAGEGALYFNQDYTGSNFSTVFESYLINENDIRNDLIDNGLNIIKLASWNKTAQQYADFYKRIIK